jgi:hypothetical protein
MRIYEPSKAYELIKEAKKQLYLLKTAIQTEKEEKLNVRIDKIRQLLVETEESI